jgi:phage-related protein
VSIRPEFEGDWSRSVNARASSAGRSGAGAFSKAFGAGLKGIGALAGVAIGANLASAAAGAAALAPALATAGAAAGALKLGLSGVGEAFKQAFSNSTADATAAASATKAVESAQRGLANAQRALAQARVDAAERVKDAQRGVRDAERDLADAQRDARDVQSELNAARQEAARALEDMNTRLKESQLDEREAALRLAQAQKELAAAQANPGTTPEELAKLQLAYDRATLNLQEQRTETKRLAEDTKKANKAGVEGSKQVVDAKKKISDANRNVADKERALADAQANVDKARADGQRQIENAQRAVADAAAAVADAQAAAAAQTSKFDQAMSKLAPNAQSFVRTVQSLAPAWDAMRLSVQNELFKGLDATVTGLARTTIPVLQRGLTGTAGIWNTIAKNAASGVQEMAKSGMLEDILKGANDNLRVFQNTPKQIITAFGQLSVAAQPAFNGLLQKFAGAITSFTDGIAKSFTSGGLQDAIDTAFGILSQFGTLLGNAFGVVTQIFKAASDAGGQIVGVLGAVFGELERILATPEMQAALRTLFASVARIVTAIVPVIGAIVQAVVPLVAALAPVIADLAEKIGPVLVELAGVLGKALAPIITALMPVVDTVGSVLAGIVQNLMPLLQPLGLLIGAVIRALAPVLSVIGRSLNTVLRAVVTALVPVIYALLPAVGQFGKLFADLAPLFPPLVKAVLPLLPPLTQLSIQLLQLAVDIITPLMPLIVGLATLLTGMFADAMGRLVPIMSGVIGAVSRFVKAIDDGVRWVVDRFTWLYDVLLGHSIIPDIVNGTIGWFATLWTRLREIVTAIRDGVVGRFQGLKTGALKIWSDFWGRVTSISSNALTSVRQGFDGFSSGLAGAFKSLRDNIGTIWAGLRKATKDPINFVLGTVWNKGVVKAWGRISDWVPGLPKLKELPLLAQGGMLPVQPGVFNTPTAIVGEGNPKHPEYVIPTDPKYRGRALALWQAAGGQLMEDGGILGDIVGGLKSIGGKIGSVIGTAASFLKDPGGALDSLMGKLLQPLQAIKNSAWGKLAIALPRAMFKGLQDLVSLGGSSSGPIGGSIPNGQRLAVINQALAAAGVPPPGVLAQWQAGLNTLITRESGWNPNAINRWDSNAKAGHPSQGLAQTIPGTFAAYVPASLRGRGILDPVANVAAAIRYIVSRYGNITNVQQANANRPPAGYDSGGWLQPGYTLAYNGTGRPEAVLTNSQWRTMSAAGSDGPAMFEGDLYLDSGEFLGAVHGVMNERDRGLVSVLRAGRKG